MDKLGNIVTAPVTITDIPTGIKQVTFIMHGYFDETRLVDVDFEDYSDVSVTMKPNYQYNR